VNYLDAVLIAQARGRGRAVRSARLRHRHIAERPMGLLLWQLGAEPFTAAAFALGFGPEQRGLVVPGEPRDRALAFRSLTAVAGPFNAWFEGRPLRDGTVRTGTPQVIVPNRGNLTLLRRLARRLAWLPLSGPTPADPALVRLGRHLWFLSEYSRTPGQQLIVALTDLLAEHWVTELSELEAQSLPALDAWIAPPAGLTGHEAATRAERIQIGPAPDAIDDTRVDPLIEAFNRQRSRQTAESIVRPLRGEIRAHYTALVDRGWPLLWRALERERAWPEAPGARRRWAADTAAFARHLEYTLRPGSRLRRRHTHVQAAITLRGWEDALQQQLAEEALDDPLRMAASLMGGDALSGTVIALDMTHREQGNVRTVLRPLMTLKTDEPCAMPPGKRLWWTEWPRGQPWEVRETTPHPDGGTRMVVCHGSGSRKVARPAVGAEIVLSIHKLVGGPWLRMPREVPWTHQAAPPTPTPRPVESRSERWE